MIENPRTGERIEFEVRTPELLVIDTVWTRPGHRAVEHVHPEMEECFEVIEGRAAFRHRRHVNVQRETDEIVAAG